MPYREVIYADVRTGVCADYNSGDQRAQINQRGDFLITQALPPKTELARLANSWYCIIATGSAFTNVATYPASTGTRAEFVLYNGYTDKTCMVIDQVWYVCVTSITAAAAVTLLYQVIKIAAPTDDATQLISSPLGASYSGSVTRAVAVTTMVTNKWGVLATQSGGAAASIGLGCVAEVNGGIIVRPGYTIGLNAIVGTGVGTALMGCSWHEVKLPLL